MIFIILYLENYSDAAQKGKTTFINCVVREGIEVHLAMAPMAPMATRKIR
jgi:hypothetical protein